jgi:hypothetical protein
MNNKFNRNKLEQLELNRLQNINKKPNVRIPTIYKFNNTTSTNFNIDVSRENHYDKINKVPVEKRPIIYKFNNTTTNKFNINLSRENNYDKIPKIALKERPIPYYSETDKFDLNKINSNISSPIHMNIITSDTNNNADINQIKKKGIYKIIHVYQEKYKYNTHPTGFGDFIRGCFFIDQFCTKFNFQYNIVINHPISKFLKNFSSDNSIANNYNNIDMFTETNFEKCVYDEESYIKNITLIQQTFNRFLNYLYNLPVIKNSVFSYNILFPYHDITPELANKMKALFQPSNEINDKVNEILTNLQLVKNNFFVLHIRSGDSYLIDKNNKFDLLYFQTLKDEIAKFIANNNNINILLIADNNSIKVLLNNIFPNIKFIIHDITHIGEGTQLEEDKVKNTMLDFFLMANSSFIFSLTSYSHGTGFSYWCSKIYNIPYHSKFINVL